MFGAVLGLALSGLLFFILHVTGSGSFPRPLTAQEEKECLERMKNGDVAAKNELIEHNLRLVAHIINNGPSKRGIFMGKRRTSLLKRLFKRSSILPERGDVNAE